MISIGLCAAAFLACVYMGRKSLVAGLCTLMAVGYAYGIVRANLPDGFSHLIFDAGTLGLYAAQLDAASAGVAAHAVRGRAQLADRADCVADVAVRHALAGSADSAGRPARQHLPAAVRAARLAAHRRRRLQAGAVVRRAERRRGPAGGRRVHHRHRAVLPAQRRHRDHLSQQGPGELHRATASRLRSPTRIPTRRRWC